MTGTAYLTADVAIVGAGSAGCVAAAALAGVPGRVVVLEAGPVTDPPPGVTDLRTLPIHAGGERVRRYSEARGRDIVRGSGIGGSSVVNGGYFLRGHRADYADWPWPADELEAAFDALDGPGGSMRVGRFADAELGPVPTAFEQFWAGRGTSLGDGAWPAVGLNRVRSNRVDGHRWSAANVGAGRGGAGPAGGPELIRATVTGLVVRGGRVVGVHTDRGRVDAAAVVLAAGTLGTAALLVPHLGPLRVFEHVERIVRFIPRGELPRTPLLQTVLHTADGLELRCYSDDFAAYIAGLGRAGVPIGVADMTRPLAGTILPEGDGMVLDLGEPDARSRVRLDGGVGEVVAMLHAPEFAVLVEPGSVRADPVVGVSMHAWGTLPAGTRTGPDGALADLPGVWVVDGSILPGPLRSGPHATVMAVAAVASDRIATQLGR